jgi:hypothetical protein
MPIAAEAQIVSCRILTANEYAVASTSRSIEWPDPRLTTSVLHNTPSL